MSVLRSLVRVYIPFLAGLLFLGSVGVAFGDTISDPLHGFCWGATPVCSDNGTNTPTSTNPPNFGFWISPGPQTGNYLIDILIPNNEDASPSSLSFGITGDAGTLNGDSAISTTASLFSATPWTTGDLAGPSGEYLLFSASPTNAIGAFLPSTQALDAGATGFFVYQASLGSLQLANAAGSAGPEMNLSQGLPTGSYIVGFLQESNTSTTCSTRHGVTRCTTSTTHTNVATANSGALFETGTPVPEPASIALFGTGLLTLAGFIRKRRKQNVKL